MYCTDSSPRFRDLANFFECFGIDCFSNFIAFGFTFQIFWFERCWLEVTLRNMHIQHTQIFACINIHFGTLNFIIIPAS